MSSKRKSAKSIKKKIFLLNFDSMDNGYNSIIENTKLKDFIYDCIKNNLNLINNCDNYYFKPHGKRRICLKATKYVDWRPAKNGKKKSWIDIKCEEYDKFIKGPPCKKGKAKKIYLKLRSTKKIAGFGLYLFNIYENNISLKQHKNFIKKLQKLFKNEKIYNHNEDVDWIHLKEKCFKKKQPICWQYRKKIKNKNTK